MPWDGSYDDLRRYLREFTNIGGDPAYDENGTLRLMLALVDNLREGADNLQELAEIITPEQAAFLQNLVRWAFESKGNEL